MKLLTKEIRSKLIKNGACRLIEQHFDCPYPDFYPVVKLFTPDAQCTWLLTELDPDDENRAFGLCDLGAGYPELGYVSVRELQNVRGPMGLPIERDKFFTADRPLSAYADQARLDGYVKA